MTNEIYIPNELTDTLKRLPKEQARELVQTIDRLGEHVLENSYAISKGDSEEGTMREARAGSLRVLFRYLPERNSIIIADVSQRSAQQDLAAITA